ncbi:hypothetical protein BDN72DRAFT_844942 [Pluteus cervinus]|uniref:Uncharacterized protein n=1 Tax=Pluteus cervinus TaxID=181527 RepID=A0ACD3AKC1_9AGAR|nr:hypothetical protein BDN72DRAFT_844942 [Pluteus cervinus]
MILELPVTSDNEAPQGALTRMINAISKILPFSNKGKDPTEAEESTKDPVEVEERVRVFGTISKLFPFLANCKESTKVDITQALTKRCERSSISEKRLALEGQWNSMVGLAQVVATDYPQSPPVVDEYAKPPSVLFNGSSGSLTVPEEYELPVLGLAQEPRITLNAAEEAV